MGRGLENLGLLVLIGLGTPVPITLFKLLDRLLVITDIPGGGLIGSRGLDTGICGVFCRGSSEIVFSKLLSIIFTFGASVSKFS